MIIARTEAHSCLLKAGTRAGDPAGEFYIDYKEHWSQSFYPLQLTILLGSDGEGTNSYSYSHAGAGSNALGERCSIWSRGCHGPGTTHAGGRRCRRRGHGPALAVTRATPPDGRGRGGRRSAGHPGSAGGTGYDAVAGTGGGRTVRARRTAAAADRGDAGGAGGDADGAERAAALRGDKPGMDEGAGRAAPVCAGTPPRQMAAPRAHRSAACGGHDAQDVRARGAYHHGARDVQFWRWHDGPHHLEQRFGARRRRACAGSHASPGPAWPLLQGQPAAHSRWRCSGQTREKGPLENDGHGRHRTVLS